jgi:hypothetical protein
MHFAPLFMIILMAKVGKQPSTTIRGMIEVLASGGCEGLMDSRSSDQELHVLNATVRLVL